MTTRKEWTNLNKSSEKIPDKAKELTKSFAEIADESDGTSDEDEVANAGTDEKSKTKSKSVIAEVHNSEAAKDEVYPHHLKLFLLNVLYAFEL